MHEMTGQIAGRFVWGVQVRLKEYGCELIEVADNGSGILPENYQALTLKYHTSKLADVADLQAGNTVSFFAFLLLSTREAFNARMLMVVFRFSRMHS